jgi:hypothetical protein
MRSMASPPPFRPDPAPIRVQPLSYADPSVHDTGQRPGILVAMGMASVVVGALALFINGWAYKPAQQLYDWSAPPVVAAPLPAFVPAVPPHMGDYIGARGLKRAARQRVLEAIERRERLFADRREMLDRFLADAGEEALGRVDDATAVDVRDVRHAADGPDGVGLTSDIVVTSLGQIEINNQVVRFTSASGRMLSEQFNSFTNGGMTPCWSAWAIDQVLQREHREKPNLSPIQGAALAAALRGLPAKVPDYSWQLPNVGMSLLPNSTTFAGFIEGRTFWCIADGRMLYPPDGADWDPMTGGPRINPSQLPMTLPIPRWATTTLLADLWASAALALMVIVAVIGVMAEASWAGELHRIYATLKLTLVVVTVTASVALICSWDQARGVAAQRGVMLQGSGEMTWRTLVGAAIWIVWPITVLLILASERVKLYYGRIGSVPWLVPAGMGRWAVDSHALWLVIASVAAMLGVGQGILLVARLRGGDATGAAGRCLALLVCCGIGAVAVRWWMTAARQREAA